MSLQLFRTELRLPASALDPADHFRVQNIFRSRHVALPDDRDHPDSHVENLIHFCAINLSHSADEIENCRDPPTVSIDHRIAIFWQDAREIVDQSAAGDVREALNHPARHFHQGAVDNFCACAISSSPTYASNPAIRDASLSRIFSNRIFRASE